MRPIQLMEQPVFTPYVCKKCGVGVGGEGRVYFIDIGIDDDMAQDFRDQGAIYFCNLCAHNMVVDMITVMQNWNEEHVAGPAYPKDPTGKFKKSEPGDPGSPVGDSGSEGIDDSTEPTVDADAPTESATFDQPGDGSTVRESGSLTF